MIAKLNSSVQAVSSNSASNPSSTCYNGAETTVSTLESSVHISSTQSTQTHSSDKTTNLNIVSTSTSQQSSSSDFPTESTSTASQNTPTDNVTPSTMSSAPVTNYVTSSTDTMTSSTMSSTELTKYVTSSTDSMTSSKILSTELTKYVTSSTDNVTTSTMSSTELTNNVTSSTIFTTTVGECLCTCSDDGVNLTQVILQEKIEARKRFLTVNKSLLSSTIRKKESAGDSRASAKGIGALGVVFIVFVFGGIVLMDLHTFYMHLSAKCSRTKKFQRRVSRQTATVHCYSQKIEMKQENTTMTE